MNIFTDTEEAFDYIQYLFMILKNPSKLRIEGNFLFSLSDKKIYKRSYRKNHT